MPKINLNQIGEVEVETLPFRESRYQYLQRKIGGMWSYNCNIEYHYYHPENNPYKISKRIIENNVGKSFDMAFRYYCKKVEQRHQKQFLEDFNDSRWYRRYNDYIIDDDGNIQVNEKRYKKNKNSVFYSDGYQSELRHVVTGDKKEHFKECYEYEYVLSRYGSTKGTYIKQRKNYYGNKPDYYEYVGKNYKKLPVNKTYIAVDEDFIEVVIKGWKKEFESCNDPELRRLISIRENKKKKLELKIKKQNKLINQIRFDEVLQKSKDKIKKEKELDKQKMVRKGFDPLTSFRNIKKNE